MLEKGLTGQSVIYSLIFNDANVVDVRNIQQFGLSDVLNGRMAQIFQKYTLKGGNATK